MNVKRTNPVPFEPFDVVIIPNKGVLNPNMTTKYNIPIDLSAIDSYNLKGTEAIKIRLTPTPEQWRHLTAFLAMLVAIVIAYQFSITRLLLYPFELISTVFHEFGHAFMTLLTGGRVTEIEINPNESGVTRFQGGFQCLILPAGYLGSSLAGAVLLVLSFGEKSSKVAAAGTGVVLLSTIYWAGSIFTAISVLFMTAAMLIVYFCFPKHLSKVILFMGVMGSLVSLLNIFSHLITNTIEGSDAVQFARHCSVLIPSMFYGIGWFVFSIILIVGSMALGVYIYK